MAYDGRRPTEGTGLRKSFEPAPMPGSTFVRPPTTSGKNNLLQIADALGSLMPGMQKLGAKAQADQKTADERQAMILSAKSLPEFRKAVANSPRGQEDAYQIALARQEALGWDQELKELVSNYNPDTDGPMDAYISGAREARRNTIGSDVGQASFVKFTERATFGAISAWGTAKAEEAVQERNNGVLIGMGDAMNRARERGGSAKEQVDTLIPYLHSEAKINNLSKDQQQALFYQLAQQEAAAGNFDTVNEMLKSNRGGVSKPLMEDPEYRAKSLQLLDAAQAQSVQNYKRDYNEADIEADGLINEGRFDREAFAKKYPKTPAVSLDNYDQRNATQSRALAAAAAKEAEKLRLKNHAQQEEHRATQESFKVLMSGDARIDFEERELPTETGGTKTMSIEEQVTAGENQYRKYREELRQTILDNTGSEAEADAAVLDTDLRVYSKNSQLENKEWTRMFTGIEAHATPTMLQNNGPTPELDRAFTLYGEMRNKDPILIDKHVKGKTGEFFDIAYSLQFAGFGKNEALMRAAEWRSGELLFREPDQKFFTDKELSGAFTKAYRGFFTSTPNFSSNDMAKLKRQAEIYTKVGLNRDAALEAATNWFATKHKVVNGRATWVGSQSIPEDFPELAEAFFDNFVEKHGKDFLIDDPKKLTLRPINPDSDEGWMVMETDDFGLQRAVRSKNGTFVRIGKEALPKIKKMIKAQEFSNAERERLDGLSRENDPYVKPGGNEFTDQIKKGEQFLEKQDTEQRRRNNFIPEAAPKPKPNTKPSRMSVDDLTNSVMRRSGPPQRQGR